MLRILAALALLASTFPAAAGELPAEIAKRGSIRIAIVPNYPPLEFKDPASGTLTGFDVELGQAIAQKLGLKIDWQETSFDQMIPSIASGRVDAIMSGMTDLATRHETATFVDYLKSGPQFFVRAADGAAYADMKALCGKSVGASRRTSFPKEIEAWSNANCTGAAPVKFVGTEGSADARTQLRQGRIDAAVQGNETLPYIMQLEPNTYTPLGKTLSSQFTGIALPVKEQGLQQEVVRALDALIADGTYKTLLTKWKLSDNGIEKAMTNAGQ